MSFAGDLPTATKFGTICKTSDKLSLNHRLKPSSARDLYRKKTIFNIDLTVLLLEKRRANLDDRQNVASPVSLQVFILRLLPKRSDFVSSSPQNFIPNSFWLI